MVKVEGNHAIDPANYADLIPKDGNLSYLGVRYCQLSTSGVKAIADKVGNLKSPNLSLLSLDLSGNKITDEGACYISQALRCNRSIKLLSLGNNCISDIGVMAICEVVTKFYLKQEELVHRRTLNLELALPKLDFSSDYDTTSRYSGSGFISKDAKVKGRRNDNAGKKGKERLKPLLKPKVIRNRRSIKPTEVDETDTKHENSDELELIHPLLATGEVDPTYGFRIHGNYELTMINLSRNKITSAGLELLKQAVALQTERLTTASENINKGLTTVLIKDNYFDENDENLEKLQTELTRKLKRNQTL